MPGRHRSPAPLTVAKSKVTAVARWAVTALRVPRPATVTAETRIAEQGDA